MRRLFDIRVKTVRFNRRCCDTYRQPPNDTISQYGTGQKKKENKRK